MEPNDDTLVSPRQAAALAGVTRATIATWARQGRLTFEWGTDDTGQSARMFRTSAVSAVVDERDRNGGRLPRLKAA